MGGERNIDLREIHLLVASCNTFNNNFFFFFKSQVTKKFKETSSEHQQLLEVQKNSCITKALTEMVLQVKSDGQPLALRVQSEIPYERVQKAVFERDYMISHYFCCTYIN